MIGCITGLPDCQIQPGLTPLQKLNDLGLTAQRCLDLDHHGTLGMLPQMEWTGDPKHWLAILHWPGVAGDRGTRSARQFGGQCEIGLLFRPLRIGDNQATFGHACTVQIDMRDLQADDQPALQVKPCFDEGFGDDQAIPQGNGHPAVEQQRRVIIN